MLTSVGRTAGRRVLFARGPAQLLRQHTATCSASRKALREPPVLPVYRTFSSTRVVRMTASPSTSAAAATKKTSTSSSKTKAKKKPAAKKTKTAKKAAPKKKKAKKTLTPEQQKAVERNALRKIALLNTPSYLPVSKFTLYVKQNVASGSGRPLTEQMKAISAAFKNLPAAEMERLAQEVDGNAERNKQTKENWVRSYPPEVVYLANLARGRLVRSHNAKLRTINDDRAPKRGGNAYTEFVKARAPDVITDSGLTGPEGFRRLADEWRTLPASEKQAYKDAAAQGKTTVDRKQMRDKAVTYWENKGVTQVKSLKF